MYTHNNHHRLHLWISRNLFGFRFHLAVHSLLSLGLPWFSAQKMDKNSLDLSIWDVVYLMCAVCNLTSFFLSFSRIKQKKEPTFMKSLNEEYGEYFFARILNFCEFLLFLIFWLLINSESNFVCIGTLYWFRFHEKMILQEWIYQDSKKKEELKMKS